MADYTRHTCIFNFLDVCNIIMDVTMTILFSSFKDAIKFACNGQFDGILAVGGGSVMDTAKAANLYMCCRDNDFLDFVNAPIGKGLPITATLKPLICSKFHYTI